jgi:hypothetical protein
MIDTLPIEFWVAFQIVVDLVLVILILYLLRTIRTGLHRDISRSAAENLTQMIEPFLLEAKSASASFEKQLMEKSKLINTLNSRLDNKIITLNLLLNRTDDRLETAFDKPVNSTVRKTHVVDQQNRIVELYQNGADAETIAKELSLPKGEVELVLDLKSKLMAWE